MLNPRHCNQAYDVVNHTLTSSAKSLVPKLFTESIICAGDEVNACATECSLAVPYNLQKKTMYREVHKGVSTVT